jgi:hypothetical protein
MIDKSIAQVLRDAADECGKPGAWCQGSSSRDQFGRDTREFGTVAVSYWMLGHVAKQANLEQWRIIFPLVASLTRGSPTRWNDIPERTQAEVVAKLREAAALAEEQAL